MSKRDQYPAGVPCWVESLQPDPRAALDFYGPLFGWEFVGPGPMPGGPTDDFQYFVARLRGRDVAGICSLPDANTPPAWVTYVRVDRVDDVPDKVKKAGGTVLDGPVDAAPAGRMAVIADPDGAVVCAWEAGVREGAQLVNEPGAWAMSALQTTDPERATAFYGAAFGWQAESFGPPGSGVALFRRHGYVGGEPQQPVPRDVVAVMMPIPGGVAANGVRPHWQVDFWVADAEATAAHAAKLGGKVIVPPHDVPGFKNTVIADPQGAVFSASQLMGPH